MCFAKADAKWIWFKESMENQYVDFSHTFEIGTVSADACLWISVDGEYAVYINGDFVDCGQYNDFPKDKVYDVLSVGRYLKNGKNIISIISYYQGNDSFQYIKGESGLIFALENDMKYFGSGSHTLCRMNKEYLSGTIDRMTMQLGFTFCYDASNIDGWIKDNCCTGSEWVSSTIKTLPLPQSIRPIQKTVIKEPVQCIIKNQGVFMRKSSDDYQSVAQQMKEDYLCTKFPQELIKKGFATPLPNEEGMEFCETEEGIFLIIDLGREETGHIYLDIKANEGAIIDIAVGEHLEDLRVRTFTGGRNYACRYICSKGRQEFFHPFLRFAGRYIQINISGNKQYLKLHYAGLIPSEYPLKKMRFELPDKLHQKIYDTCVRTLELCMHEHYEDCPSREQALYAMDGRNQALCGYYCFEEFDFAKASIDLLAKGIREDGFLTMTAPSSFAVTIPCFSLSWIIMAEEYITYSKRNNEAQNLLNTADRIIKAVLKNSQNDLALLPQGEECWHFYEWSDGLSGTTKDLEIASRIDAVYQLFLALALKSVAVLAQTCGQEEQAKKYQVSYKQLCVAFHKEFWRETEKAYCSYSNGDKKWHFAELTQAMAICAGVCDENTADVLLGRLAQANNGLIRITLSHKIFKYQALLQDSKNYSEYVFNEIANIWGNMLFSGSTSFWETELGANDFDYAGSLCHGWSATPAYFYHTCKDIFDKGK